MTANNRASYGFAPIVVVIVALGLLAVGLFAYYFQNKTQKETTTTSPVEKQLGFIKKVYEKDGDRFLEIDYAQWLNGDEAIKAAKEDGKCPADVYPDPSYCIPNGYYIRNNNPLIRTFKINNDAEISRLGIYDLDGVDSSKVVKITFEEFKNLLMDNSTYSKTFTSIIPFWIFIKDGAIEKIEEQYIP